MARHNETGKWGENVACEYLKSKGYAIVDRNWRSGHYEVDIIAMSANRIIFVEVKTRDKDMEAAYDAFDTGKQRRLVHSANAFVQAYNIPHDIQYDLITIVGEEHNYRMEHHEDLYLTVSRNLR